MARNRKRAEAGEPIEINDLRELLKTKIIEKYGSIASFMKSDFGISLGGPKIRTYLYNSGSTNFRVLKELCTFFEIGDLTKKECIVRTVTYRIVK